MIFSDRRRVIHPQAVKGSIVGNLASTPSLFFGYRMDAVKGTPLWVQQSIRRLMRGGEKKDGYWNMKVYLEKTYNIGDHLPVQQPACKNLAYTGSQVPAKGRRSSWGTFVSREHAICCHLDFTPDGFTAFPNVGICSREIRKIDAQFQDK